jgi:GTP pyrophosphokinase
MKRELEDLAFRTLHPTIAAELERKLKGRHQERERYIEEVKGILTEKLVGAGFRIEITGRLKDLASIHNKMETQGLGLDEIYDVIAFRIILEGEREVVYSALGLVHAIWPPVPGPQAQRVPVPPHHGDRPLR